MGLFDKLALLVTTNHDQRQQLIKEGKIISKDEIRDIVRIDYLHSSNWTLGFENIVWVLKIEDGKVIRQVYTGKPLVPEYTKYEDEAEIEYNRKEAEALRNGEKRFVNSYTAEQLFTKLEELGIQNWETYNHGDCIDGDNRDFAFYVKKNDGSIKMYRYMFMEESADEKTEEFFWKLFEVSENGDYEKTSPDNETIANFERYEPGDYQMLIEKRTRR